MGMNVALIWIIRIAKQSFDFPELISTLKGSIEFFLWSERSLEEISSVIRNAIPTPLELRSNLYVSLYPFIRN